MTKIKEENFNTEQHRKDGKLPKMGLKTESHQNNLILFSVFSVKFLIRCLI
jgi:hypothetical protein